MATSRLQLHCNVRDSLYTLSKEGEDEGEKFGDLELALRQASQLVEEETVLIIFNEKGMPIIETAVRPRAIA